MKKKDGKQVLVATILILLICSIAGLFYYNWNENKSESKEDLKTTYQLQNNAFAIGSKEFEYKDYNEVDEDALRFRLMYYSITRGEALTLKEVEAFLEDEYKDNGKAKIYPDDKKIATYVEWCNTDQNIQKVDTYTSELQKILILYGHTDIIMLDEYKDMQDDAVVKYVPLGLIRKLRTSFGKEVIGEKDTDLYIVSDETLAAAQEIYENREEQ